MKPGAHIQSPILFIAHRDYLPNHCACGSCAVRREVGKYLKAMSR